MGVRIVIIVSVFLLLFTSVTSLKCYECRQETSPRHTIGDCCSDKWDIVECTGCDVCVHVRRNGKPNFIFKTFQLNSTKTFLVSNVNTVRRGCASKDFCEKYRPDSVANFEYTCDTCDTDLCNGCDYEEQPKTPGISIPTIVVRVCRPVPIRPVIRIKTVKQVDEEHRRIEVHQRQNFFAWN